MISFIVLTILILVSWLRIARPRRNPVPGRGIYDARVPLLARLRMHLVPCTIVLGAAVLLVAFADLPRWGPIVAIAANTALVAMPVHYTLTTVGLRCGWTPFRRWTEFAGVSRAPGGARLQGSAGGRDMRIWLSGSRDDDEFVLLLRHMISGAYKGRNRLLTYPTKSTTSGSSAASTDITRTAI